MAMDSTDTTTITTTAALETDRRLNVFVFGDLGSSGRDNGRLLAGYAFLSVFGPWVLFADEVIHETQLEISVASIIFSIHSAAALALLLMILLQRADRPRRHSYWIITGGVAFSMVSLTHAK